MLRLVVRGLLFGALVCCGTASATAVDKSMNLGRVTALDETSQSIGAGIAWSPGSCERVVLWLPWENARWTFHLPGACPATSTGRGISAVAALEERVLFLSYVGGNTREWRLWTATTTSPRPRLLRSASADADAPSPIVVGNAGDEGMPYAVGRDVVVLGPYGRRVLTWRAPGIVTSLSEAAGLVAAVLADGRVVLIRTADGSELFRVSASGQRVLAARPIANAVVVQTPAGLTLYRPKSSLHLGVPAHARLAGDFDEQLVYVLGHEIRMYAHRTGKDVLVRHVDRPGVVDADRRGLAWSTGQRLCWTVRVYLTPPYDSAPGCS
jgi:hypothetical protein